MRALAYLVHHQRGRSDAQQKRPFDQTRGADDAQSEYGRRSRMTPAGHAVPDTGNGALCAAKNAADRGAT